MTNLNDLDFSACIRSFERQARSATTDEELAQYAKGMMQDARLDYPDNRSADALAAVQLLPYVRKSHFVATKRILYDRMFLRWRKTDVPEIETSLATALLARPSIFGPSPEVEAWDGAIDYAMERCYDEGRLKRLIKLARKRVKNTLRTKALQKLDELLDPAVQDFVGDCLNALGPNPNSLSLVGEDVIAYIERSAQLAAWKFAMPFTIINLENEKVKIIYPDTIEVIGDLNRYGSTRNSRVLLSENLEENERRVQEAWDKLKKPKGSACIVRLVVDGVPREISLY
jgi:hypothetical protein